MSIEPGARVKVKRGADVGLHDSFIGKEGEVITASPHPSYEWEVLLDGDDLDFHGTTSFNTDELEVTA